MPLGSLFRRPLLGFLSQSRSGREQAVRTHSRAEGLSGRVGRGYAHAKDEEGRGSAHADLAAAPFLADKKLFPDVKGCERTAGQPFRMRSWIWRVATHPRRPFCACASRTAAPRTKVRRLQSSYSDVTQNAQGNSRSFRKKEGVFFFGRCCLLLRSQNEGFEEGGIWTLVTLPSSMIGGRVDRKGGVIALNGSGSVWSMRREQDCDMCDPCPALPSPPFFGSGSA